MAVADLTLEVRVKPRARTTGVSLQNDTMLVVSVNEPPVDGKANAAVIATLAKKLGVAKSSISILRGQSGRSKVLKFENLELQELKRRLES
jgi:uncharacterized protein (TIGR00251 family)